MDITPKELTRRGYIQRPDLVNANISDAYAKDRHILYLKGSSWFLQPKIDFPATRKKPISTLEELAFVLWDEDI
jgi:hypothetical protein